MATLLQEYPTDPGKIINNYYNENMGDIYRTMYIKKSFHEWLHILEWPCIVASLRHTCAIIILSNQHLDMPHLWGGWIMSVKEKISLTQI